MATTTELLDGVVGQRTEDIRFEVLDADGNLVNILHPSGTGTVAWNPTNRITRTLTGVRLDPTEAVKLTPGQHRLRPVWVLPLTGGENQLGVFLYIGGAQVELAGGTWVECSPMPDQSWQLDQKLSDLLQVAASTVLTTAFTSVAQGGGITSLNVTGSSATLGATPLTYAPGKDSRLACLDQLTNLLAYLPCYFDHTGTLVARPVPVPTDSFPDHRYYNGQNSRIIADSVSTSTKLTPNVYLVYSTSPSGVAVFARYDVPATAANSRANIGFEIVSALDIPGLADTTQALAAATAQAKRDAATATTITFASPPDPRHDAWGIVDFNGTLMLEVGWSLELQPNGKHTHTLASVYA